MNNLKIIRDYILTEYFSDKTHSDELVGVLNNYLTWYANVENINLEVFVDYFEHDFQWIISFIKSVDCSNLSKLTNKNLYDSIQKINKFSQTLIALNYEISFSSKFLNNNTFLVNEINSKRALILALNEIFDNKLGISVVFALDLEKQKELVHACLRKNLKTNPIIINFYNNYIEKYKFVFHELYNNDQLVIDLTKNKSPNLWKHDFMIVANELTLLSLKIKTEVKHSIVQYNEKKFSIFYPDIFSYKSGLLQVKNDKKKYDVSLNLYTFVSDVLAEIMAGSKGVKVRNISDIGCLDDLLTTPDAHEFKKKYLVRSKGHLWSFTKELPTE